MLSICSSLAVLPDPRRGNAWRHKLLDVLTIALTASICGAASCVDFADFARNRESLFRGFFELPGGCRATKFLENSDEQTARYGGSTGGMPPLLGVGCLGGGSKRQQPSARLILTIQRRVQPGRESVLNP